MTSIDPTGRLLAHLRAQTQDLRREASAAGAPRRPGAERSQATQRRTFEEQLAAGVAAIANEDPQRRRKAFRVFLEAVLLREIEPALINSPGFASLVDRVQSTMESDAALKPAIDEAGALILARHASS